MAGESEQTEMDQLLDYFGRLHFPSLRADVVVFEEASVVDLPEGVVCLLVVIRGVCSYHFHADHREVDGGNPVPLCRGDLLIDGSGAGGQAVLNGSITTASHRQERRERIPIDVLLDDSQENRSPIGTHGGGPGPELLFLRLDRQEITNHSLNGVFPENAHVGQHRMDQLMPFSNILNVVSSTAQMRSPGWKTTIRKLGEIVFLNVLASKVHDQLSESGDVVGTMPGYQMVAVLTDGAIGPVVRALMDRPADPWTVPAMAKIADVSKSAFFERFKKLTGAAPLKFLTEIRMQRACRLLSESRFEISLVATQVGYESHSSFSNLFKRWSGMSPAEFRRTHREANGSGDRKMVTRA